MANKSLKSHLVFDILCDEKLFTPEERLYVVLSVGTGDAQTLRLAELYYQCGCLDQAAELYKPLKAWRRLGEIAWAKGDEDAALDHFTRPVNAAERCYQSEDFDRTLVIWFMRRDWFEFVNTFLRSRIRHVEGHLIVVTGLAVDGRPWLRRLAIAVTGAGLTDDKELEKRTLNSFALKKNAWATIMEWASQISNDELDREIEKSRPRFMTRPLVTVKAAKAVGNTVRSNELVRWIRRACEEMRSAKLDLNAWLNQGDENALNRVVTLATGSGLFTLTRTFFWQLAGSYPTFEGARATELYRSHPFILRANLGRYILLRLTLPDDLSTDDLLRGIYQSMFFFEVEKDRREDHIRVDKLRSCEEWALSRLEKWRRGIGNDHLNALREEAQKHGKEVYDARKLGAWKPAMNSAIGWLDRDWRRMIEVSPWISENLLFNLIKEHFKGLEVLQHDEPAWLSPQHLDIHIPQLRLAVEYMGLQHYEPVDLFGGEAAFVQNTERDARKLAKCKAAGVELIYVRYDEDIAMAAKIISKRFRP